MLNVWRQIFNALSFRLEKEIYHKQNNCNPIKNQNSLEIDHGTISYVPLLAPTFMMRGWSYAAEDVGGPRLADELDTRRWNFPPPRPGPWPGIIPSYPPCLAPHTTNKIIYIGPPSCCGTPHAQFSINHTLSIYFFYNCSMQYEK